MPRTPANEFYCIEMHNLEPGDLLNALKALLEGRLSRFVSVGKDSVGKAHAFRFSPDPRGKEPAPLEPGDEEVFLPMLASRFNKNCARVRYDSDKQEGVVHRSNPKGELELIDYRLEPLPSWPGRLFERPLTWTEPQWLGSGTAPGRPERPQPNTPGYDIPMEKGSYIGGFAPYDGTAAEAAKVEVERGATGELTLRTADGMDGKVWFESGQAVGIVFDPIRGASAEKTWEAMQKEAFKERRFRLNVPRPDHIGYAKSLTNKLVPKK